MNVLSTKVKGRWARRRPSVVSLVTAIGKGEGRMSRFVARSGWSRVLVSSGIFGFCFALIVGAFTAIPLSCGDDDSSLIETTTLGVEEQAPDASQGSGGGDHSGGGAGG